MDKGNAKYYVGQVIHHKLFDYRGVIVDVDPNFQSTEDWYEQMAMSKPPRDEPDTGRDTEVDRGNAELAALETAKRGVNDAAQAPGVSAADQRFANDASQRIDARAAEVRGQVLARQDPDDQQRDQDAYEAEFAEGAP